MKDDDAPTPLDLSWWRVVVAAHHETDPPNPTFALSRAFTEAASEYQETSQARAVLEALAIAAAVRLHPENWNNPFMSLPGTIVGGLNETHLGTLRRIAAVMDDNDAPLLRARVCDLCWSYVDRGDTTLRDAALTGYVRAPLTADSWYHGGDDALQRAIEIVRRVRQDGQSFLTVLQTTVRDRVLAATDDDRFFPTQLSQLAREQGLIPAEHHHELAEFAVARAASARDNHDRELEQAWEVEAAGWYSRADRRDEAAAAAERLGMSYAAQAEDRRNNIDGHPITASYFTEMAIRTLLKLPRAYRTQHHIDERIAQLRDQLGDDRLTILENMAILPAKPLNITAFTAQAREQVSDLDPVDALLRLGVVHQLADYKQRVEQAESSLRRHPLQHMFGDEHYSSTGQKVASTPGASLGSDATNDQRNAAVWSVMVRDHTRLVGIAVSALVTPALEVVNLQHRYTLQTLYDLCTGSPVIPPGNEATWARGLLNGLNGDFASALAILVPQIEQLVRVHVKAHGIHTLATDADGAENEKGLSWLVDQPAAAEVFGPDLMFEFKALLTDKQGPNLRNTVAHGLGGDGLMHSKAARYVWWLALHIVVRPYVAQQQADKAEPTNG